MSIRDAFLLSLDAKADETTLDEAAVGELFAVVDLLDANPPLRRSLSDPSASAEDRVALAERLLGTRISAPALQVITGVVGAQGLTGRRLVAVLERQGVRALLRQARDSGQLGRVQSELFAFSSAVGSDPELADVLRNRSNPLAAKRKLVAELVEGRSHPATARLLERATGARIRTVTDTIDEYLDMAAQLADQQIAHVTVAKPLDESRADRLRRALEAQTGRSVVLQVEVDPKVLGGVSVRIGDHIYESTVAARLEDARRLLNT